MSRWPAGSNRQRSRRGERGITLVETLIALALGLIVLAGVLKMINQLVAGNTATLTTVRLAQDTRTVMDMIIQDLRRAGQYPEAGSDLGDPIRMLQDQPAALRIDGDEIRAGKTGESVTYSYREADGKLVQARFSRDAKAGTVQMHTGTAAAAETITDASVMTVTGLTFTPTVVTQSAESLHASAVAIEIRISTRLKNDPAVERQLTDRVLLRNVILGAIK